MAKDDSIEVPTRKEVERRIRQLVKAGWAEVARDSGDSFLTIILHLDGDTIRIWWRR